MVLNRIISEFPLSSLSAIQLCALNIHLRIQKAKRTSTKNKGHAEI